MESWPLLFTLTGIGLAGSFLSGLLGVGGSAFIIPMLLYIPPLAGTGQLDIKQAAGLSMALIFVGSLSGALAHRRSGAASAQCVKVLAPACAGGALVGGLLSGVAPGWLMGGVFATLALIAGLMMFLPKPPGGDELPPGARVEFPVVQGAAIALAVGLVSGLVGAGGAFILVPLMIYVLKIPTRATVASSLGIVFASALAGMAGKVMAGQIPWLMAAFTAAGAVPGAKLGAWLSHRMNAAHLRYALGALTTALAARLWLDVLQ